MADDQKQLQSYLKILGDESRFRIVMHLSKGEECVCTIAQKIGLEQTLVSHHLKTLREAGLIRDRKVSTWVYCSLNKKIFDKMDMLYRKYLSSSTISDTPCTSHELCRSMPKEKE